MKGNMMIFATLCLLLCWMLPANTMTIHFKITRRDVNNPIQLSMVEESVDDMYFGCKEEMANVAQNYFSKEVTMKPFNRAWNKERTFGDKYEAREDKALTQDHIHAICVYTSNEVYTEFNQAVRTERSLYSSSFRFHYLHFLLTSAVQILNSNYSCYTTYRRTNVAFTGNVNERIRFGFFTSSSFRTDLKNFGHETCFIINTCSGAYLKKYSCFKNEEEVLIPPYEVFKITKIMKDQDEILDLKDCNVVYVLESTGAKSNLNCQVIVGSPTSGKTV